MSPFRGLRMLRLLALATLVTVARPAHASTEVTFDHARLALTALEAHIRPGYAALAASGERLTRDVSQLCTNRTEAGWRTATAAFADFVRAWGHIEHIRFGPLVEAKLLERILFWPDRQGIAARQVRRILSTRDDAATDPGKLADKSVGVQGIGALETVLFGEGREELSSESPEGAFRCRYGSAIAANLAGIARTIAAAWSADGSAAAQWLKPGPGNTRYLGPEETTAELAKSLREGLERVRDERIAGPLGLGESRRKETPILAKSEMTGTLVTANVEGLEALFSDGGMRPAISATAALHPQVLVSYNADLVARELTTARERLAMAFRQPGPFERPDARQALIGTGFPLKNAGAIAAWMLSLTGGVTMGFNASDGD